uniref:Uncharacterized protein n=1 Tax=Siphoviridae sp. ctnpt50 TaxID=2827941 RepID=A0A8S5SEB3_9CAUD|nr:MAG TPA: hypothetical protein [Siphoviridae sp. ctnpt50]
MADTNSALTSESGCIAALPTKAMRIAMENKGLLSKAGALYCGTGKVNTVTLNVLSEDGNTTETVTYNVPVTIAVNPPQGGVKNGVTYGIQFSVIDNNVTSAVLVPVQPK